MKEVIGTIMLAKKSPNGQLVARTLRACSKDQTRYFLVPGYWDAKNKALVATDGRHMHVLSGDVVEELFKGQEKSCFVEQNGDLLVLIDEKFGQYPNWQRVMPESDKLERVKGVTTLFNTTYSIPVSLDRKSFSTRAPYLGLILEAPVQLDFLEDLMGGTYDIYRAVKSDGHRRWACKFVEDCPGYVFTAVIMPLSTITEVQV